MKQKTVCLNKKLHLLEPDENTIISYREIETKSIDRLKEFLQNGNDEKYNKISTQILATINKLRSTMKSQMAMRAQIFKDISQDKKEFKQYIKISFPYLMKRKEA